MNPNLPSSDHAEHTQSNAWVEAMQDVEFSGNAQPEPGQPEPAQPELNQNPAQPESSPSKPSIIEGLLGKISGIGKLFRRRLQAKDSAQPTLESILADSPIYAIDKTPSAKSISEVIREMGASEMEYSGERPLRPKSEIICDRDHIEDQRINVINRPNDGTLEFSFKLRAPTETVASLLNTAKDVELGEIIKLPDDTVLHRGYFLYEDAVKNKLERPFNLCNATIIERDDVRISIADPTSRDDIYNPILNGNMNQGGLIRSAIGLVRVEIPSKLSPEEIENLLATALSQDLGIPDALAEVPADSEREYKTARYNWQHKIIDNQSRTPEASSSSEHLEKREVFPGYTTFVDKGKYHEYLKKYGADLRPVHHLYDNSADSIFRVLTGGLMSTTERFSRGLIQRGMSSATDIDTGGADNVFTRILDKKRRNGEYGTLIVFRPELFDRTDWYAYDHDKYGTTEETSFKNRFSPEKLFARLHDAISNNENYPHGNEQMFRTGIGPEYIESIEVDPRLYDKLVEQLKSHGLTEVNGKPIEDIIVAREAPDYLKGKK